jgi:phage terminase small subunit
MRKTAEDRQERFCKEYIKDHNATKAAIRAGYSKKTAKQQGSRLLSRVDIEQRIKKLEERISNTILEKVVIDRSWVLEKYRQFVEFDPRKMFDADGKILPVPELDDETALAITSFDMDCEVAFDKSEGDKKSDPVIHEYVKKVKAADKKGALDSIAKILGLFIEKHEHTGKDGKPIETKDVSDLETARRVAFLLEKGKRELEQEKPNESV